MPFTPPKRFDDEAATVASEDAGADWGESIKGLSG
jgi:hypothetical protein